MADAHQVGRVGGDRGAGGADRRRCAQRGRGGGADRAGDSAEEATDGLGEPGAGGVLPGGLAAGAAGAVRARRHPAAATGSCGSSAEESLDAADGGHPGPHRGAGAGTGVDEREQLEQRQRRERGDQQQHHPRHGGADRRRQGRGVLGDHGGGELGAGADDQRHQRWGERGGVGPAHALPEPGLPDLGDQPGSGDRRGRGQDHQRRGPGEHDDQVTDRGEQHHEPHHAQNGGQGAVAEVLHGDLSPGLPRRPRVDAHRGLHERLGQAGAGVQQDQHVGHPGGPDHDELGRPDQQPGHGAAVAAERRDPGLHHGQGDHQGERDPERGPVGAAHRPGLAKVRGEEGVDEPQDQLQEPQPGVPERQHRRRPGVGGDLAGGVAQSGERVDQVTPALHRHHCGDTPDGVGHGVHPCPVSAHASHPAEAARSVPGHVEGAVAGWAPGAICQRSSCHCIRSQCPYAIEAVRAMVASTLSSTHATTHPGPSVPFTCPAAGMATTSGGAPAGAAGPAAARNARTLLGHHPLPHRRCAGQRPPPVDFAGAVQRHAGHDGGVDGGELADRPGRGSRVPGGDPGRPLTGRGGDDDGRSRGRGRGAFPAGGRVDLVHRGGRDLVAPTRSCLRQGRPRGLHGGCGGWVGDGVGEDVCEPGEQGRGQQPGAAQRGQQPPAPPHRSLLGGGHQTHPDPVMARTIPGRTR